MINFSHEKNVNKKEKVNEEGNGAIFSGKQGRLKCSLKCNPAKHFAHDCLGSRNDINSKIIHCFKCNSAQHFIYDCAG